MNVEGEGRAVAAPCIGFALSRLLLAKPKLELHRLPVVSNKLIGDSLNVNLHAVDDDAADVAASFHFLTAAGSEFISSGSRAARQA